jgi:hypothetical protein
MYSLQRSHDLESLNKRRSIHSAYIVNQSWNISRSEKEHVQLTTSYAALVGNLDPRKGDSPRDLLMLATRAMALGCVCGLQMDCQRPQHTLH